MLREIDEELCGRPPELIVVPVGVGSLAHAVVAHAKFPGRNTAILAVEPDTAASLRSSLEAGRPVVYRTGSTIMSGMNCGTISSIAWPILQAGVDYSVTVSDADAHEAVVYLESIGISVGPCGAAPLAALRHAMKQNPDALGLGADSTVVLLCTEGSREYDPRLQVPASDVI